MRQWKKDCLGLLILASFALAAGCGSTEDGTAADDAGTAGDGTAAETESGLNVDDILFDTDGDGVYDHTDVDGDGLLEEIGMDTNDAVDDLVNDLDGDDADMVDGDADSGLTEENGAMDGTDGVETP